MINLQIPINQLGYGVAGTNIAKSLLKTVPVHIQPIGQLDESLIDLGMQNALEKNVIEHQPSWPLVKIWHQTDFINRIGTGKYFGFPIFELDTFAFNEICHLKIPDEIIVCSHWAKQIILNHVNKKVGVVPLGVNRDIFHENYETETTEKPYKFFTIGKLEYRKGHDFIVNCFNKAFEVSDNVELNMMVHNPFLPSDITNKWYTSFKNTKLSSKINIINRVKTHKDVAEFISQNDCGLFPARAEGWNLELLESMSCGKPAIATNYSAHTEFCNNKNSYLIEIDGLEKAHDMMGGIWFRGQGNWAELGDEQEEQMINHMRYCYKNQPKNEEGISTAKEFSWDNSVIKLLEIVKDE